MIFLYFWLLTSSLATEISVFPYPTEHRVLPNGLTVIVVPMDTPNVAQVRTWMAVGSRDELDPGRTGFAHFFEHLMFYGTPTLSREAREQRIQTFGAEENAWTWFDDTVYHATLSSKHVEAYIRMEGDRFQNLHLTEDMVRTEAGAVYGEFRKGQSSPVNRMYETLYSTAFQTHTYHHDTIGTEEDIADMPSAYRYSTDFFTRFYRPEFATVLVVGDVTPEMVFQWTEESYGSWQAGKTQRPLVPEEPKQKQIRTKRIDWPSPTAPQLAMAWKAPAYQPADKDYVALNLLASLLNGDVGPLNERLVRQEKLAYSVYTEVDAFVDPGLFKIVVELKSPEAFDRVESIIREELAKLSKEIDPDWFENTRAHDRYQTLTSLDNPDSVASQLGWAWRRTGSLKAIDTFYSVYQSLSPEDVSTVIQNYIQDTSLTRVQLASAVEKEMP